MSESAEAKRRGAVALVVLAAHVTAFLLMRYELLHPEPAAEAPELVSIWLPAETIGRSRTARQPNLATGTVSAPHPTRKPMRAAQAPPSVAPPLKRESSVARSTARAPNKASPPPVAPPHAIDWLGEAERAARDEVASEADRKRRAEWLSRGTDAESHPLVRAFKPLFPKTPEFGWYHARTHRIEPIKGGPLLIWINDRCFLALLGLAIIPVCKIGHIEPDGALFEHMHDEAPFEVPLAVP